MAGFFSKLFSRPNEEPADSISPDDIVDFHDQVASQLLAFIWPQLQMLNFNLHEVPITGSFGSKRSRGYIYGIGARVLAELPPNLRPVAVHDVMETAFALVYGNDIAADIYRTTLNESVARDGETLAGSYQAEQDVGAVLEGQPHRSVMGFWILNNGIGDPEEKMPAIQNPRPLTPF